MSSLVIVAIPADDEPVWKLSSEKIPHLTLLFLGEEEAVTAEQAQRITEFMDHAVTMANMGPFYLDVDYRGTLGKDNADVLYFAKGWDSKEIERIRGQLLKQTDIKTLHDAAPQFEGWTPHLTMGYPDSPAKKPDEHMSERVHMVRFDRLAIWFGDYEGPEFRLKREYVEPKAIDLAWSDVAAVGSDFLEHHGVKGMKWGVTKRERNAEIVKDAAEKAKPVLKKGGEAVKEGARRFGRAVNKAAEKAVEAEERSFVENANSESVYKGIKADAKAEYKLMDKPEINEKYFGKNVKTGPLAIQYKAEHKEAFRKRLDEQAKAYESWSGRKRYVIKDDPENPKNWYVDVEDVEHAVDTFAGARVLVTYDKDGFITDIDPEDPADKLAHLMDLGADFIEHYGVKGMQWGVRKSDLGATTSLIERNRAAVEKERRAKRAPVDPRAQDIIGPTKFNKTKIKTKGGEDHPAAEDAIKVALVQQKFKKSGPSALTNQELRLMNERMQLEQSSARLISERKNNGQGFVKNLITKNSRQTVDRATQKVFTSASDKAMEEAANRAKDAVDKRKK